MGHPKKANLTEAEVCLVSVASIGARRVNVITIFATTASSNDTDNG